MPIAVQCSNCRRRFQAPDTALGKTGACPNCGTQITIEPPRQPLRVTTVTSERVAKPKHESSSRNSLLIVVFALVVATVLVVVVFLTLALDRPEAVIQKAEAKQSAVPATPTEICPEVEPRRIEKGLGLTLDQLKRDVPIGESWKVLSDTKRDDGTVSFQLISTTMRNVLLIASGNPNDLREVSILFSATAGQDQGDNLTRIAVVAYFLAKYSNWTEEELALFWVRLVQVGAGEESEFRVQKNGHEFWIVPMGVKDGTMFMTGVSVKPDSSAPTLQTWLDDHPAPVGAGLNESTVSRGQVINTNFSFKGFRHKGRGSFIGEMTNDSKQNLQFASFRLSIYDRKAVLIDTAPIVISNFSAGQTRSFDAHVESTPGEFLYKIDFENGL